MNLIPNIPSCNFGPRWLAGLTYLLLCCSVVILSSCGTHFYHVVEQGETLYSISWMYGHDYRKVAQWNGIKSPFVIKKGQRILVVAPEPGTRQNNKSEGAARPKKSSKPMLRDVVLKGNRGKTDKKGETVARSMRKSSKTNRTRPLQWHWPTKGGKLLQTFDADDPGKRGLDITGRSGQPVYSASSGRVVYSGGGLPRYGKLIIVKHDDIYLSAYAHNKELLVEEGDVVRVGQVIARMGNSGTGRVKLHFEIRRNGRAINPLRVLPKLMP